MSEENYFASRNQQDSQSGYSITDSMYSRADRIAYTYSKAVLGIVFGAYYFYECPANEKVPIAVIVCFSIVLLTHLMNLAQDMRYILNSSVIEKPLCFRCLEVTLHIIMICIFFLECYWIYMMKPNTVDKEAENYCNFIFYHVVYWGTALTLIMTVISIPMYIAIYCCLIVS